MNRQAQLYITGINYLTQDELRTIFSAYGTVLNVKVLRPRSDKTGIAFVDFSNIVEAQAGLAENGRTVRNDTISVSISKSSQPQTAGPIASELAGVAKHYTPYPTPDYLAQMYPTHLTHQVMHAQQTPKQHRFPTSKFHIPEKEMYIPGRPLQDPKTGYYSIFIHGFAKDADELLLYRMFAPFGAIALVNMVKSSTGESKGYGFVQMPRFDEANYAVETLNGLVLNEGGQALKVKFKEYNHGEQQ